MSSIPDISERSYNNRTFPVLYAQEDFNVYSYSPLFIKDDEFSTYHYNYSTIVRLCKEGKLNLMKKILMKQSNLF